MPPGPLEIKEKSYLTDAPTSHMPINTVKLYQPRLLHTCRVDSCYVAAAAIYMPAGLVVLSQTPLLFKHAYWLSAAARWMLAGLWPLNQHAIDLLSLNIACMLALCFSICYTCWYGVSLSAVSAGLVSLYQPCLLVLCFIKGHAFSFGVSLSAMPVGVVPHYRSSLLVWCLTVGHVCWCGASLYAMLVGVVPQYRPCLLVRFALQLTFILVECRRKRDGYKSGATLTEVPLHQTCLLIQCHSQICLLVQCNCIRHVCWVHLFRNTRL